MSQNIFSDVETTRYTNYQIEHFLFLLNSTNNDPYVIEFIKSITNQPEAIRKYILTNLADTRVQQFLFRTQLLQNVSFNSLLVYIREFIDDYPTLENMIRVGILKDTNDKERNFSVWDLLCLVSLERDTEILNALKKYQENVTQLKLAEQN